MDHLTGIMQLFEIEEISIHANGGRVRNLVKKETQRLLTAFGPCMIIVEDLPCDCWRCERGRRSPFYDEPHLRGGTCYKSLVDIRERENMEWLGAFDVDMFAPRLVEDIYSGWELSMLASFRRATGLNNAGRINERSL